VKKYGILVSLAALLTGCAQAEQAESLPTLVKDNIYKTASKVTEWVSTPPAPPPGPKDVADSYCYHVLQDILCYHQPMPGWEYRLVGYQGTHAEPPAQATMQLLAKRRPDNGDTPATRAANTTPVFATVPVLPKETEKPSDQSQVIDSNHELLPDPALAPQL